MKYYKNLIKRKKYGVLIIAFCIFLLGAFSFFYNLLDVIIKNINFSDLSSYTIYNNGIIGLIGTTNIGLSLIGLFLMYIGIVYIPVNSPYAQDDSDYDIKSEGEYIHIKFKNNEFLVKKETFQPTDLFFKDKNKHFVSITRGYQIYNYVMANYKKSTEKELNDSKVILKSEVVNKFKNVKKMSNEEKINFINVHKIKNKPRWLFVITSIILWASFIFWLLGLLSFILTFDFTISNIIIALIMMIISFVLGKKSNNAILKNKKLVKRILNEDMYIVECEIYDKKYNQTQDVDGTVYNNYYIKITDGNYIVNEWIEIPKEKYNKDDNKVKFYVFDKTGSEYFLIA